MLVIGRAGDDYHEHPSCITAIPVVMKRPTDNIHTGSSSSVATTAEVVEFFDDLFDSVNCYPGGATKGKMRKAVKINSCKCCSCKKNCMKSFTSKSTEDNIYSYMRQREYKLLKNSNLVYPSSKLLVLYREASCLNIII
ncbi:uncharacterized protein LOC123698870 [Colias croceus]|uniref:uncharacterized protein LOC123698870 n=1 Tax=Colias crocea TaxID=72248 RepID=UPI001E27FD6C|nr:uncharacterized protein LOC123698870 [Colias croceus]XP_045501633.1 uncharacterized protein LOC123698870 [Colias croceus]